MDEQIAEITFNRKAKKIADIVFIKNDLRFTCKRCAVFCCMLGGPPLTEKDKERLEEARNRASEVLQEPRAGQESKWGKTLKTKEDGTCILLERRGSEQGTHRCSVYDLRPARCRLYPFEFKPTGPDTGILRLIPCCTGLNDPEGRPVDRRFIDEQLLEAMLDLL